MKPLRKRTVLAGVSALLLAGIGALKARGVMAGRLAPTPRQSKGPFYPTRLPPDHDANLLQVAGASRQAMGSPVTLGGRVTDSDGAPIPGAVVEIWQCDAYGRYHHPRDRAGQRDAGFQGYGRQTTDADGAYVFLTIRPVPYPGRTPHIHFRVSAPGRQTLTTQLYVEGEPLNARDFLYSRLSPTEQQRVTAAFTETEQTGGVAGQVARFEIVLG